MGIDRQNIPEEYLCEQCQPRSVDKLRARNLQTVKRKEQQQLLLNTQFNNSNVGGNGVLGPGVPTTIYQPQGDTKILLPSPHLGSANSTSSLNSLVSPPPIGKKSTKLTKKKEFIKKSKKDKIVGGKKRENTKKISKKKNRSGGSVGDTAAEKHAANLRQWIENYEVAVTNHYSPELRARLHAINKQTTLVNSSQNYNYLENAVSIIPHAGGKIVIANFEIQPNTPIIELMGKYMLSTQYKNQNPSKNMNSPWPPTNYLQSLKYMYKIPGPFIFFYQWTMDSLVSESNELTALNLNTVNGPEVCVDTRTYGNDARFVRRSCRPNACLKHTFVNGSIHLYIVALTKIMASTEITIRHEPHDLLAIENKQLMAANPAYQNFSVQPTSTSCACGLIKECVFGVQTKPIKEEKSNKVNKKKMLQANPNANNRNRSTSSSGESNSGVAVSPNNNILASTNNALTSLTTNVLHDSGVYTSSSSPSVSIPSPSQQLQANTNIQSQNQLPSAPVLTPTIVPVVESQISNEPVSVESSSLSNPQESQPQMQPHLLEQPIQQQQPQPQSQQPPTQKVARTPKKSISESNDVNPAADSKENSPNKAKTEEKRESRKLTRDERKLEAIVRAIEKMEKNQQKKQDSKYSKRATSGSPSPKRSKLNSSSESGGDCKIRKKKKTKNMQKGCGMPSKKSKSLKKNPLKKQFSGNDSDVFNTSEESLLSPIPPQHQTSHVDDDDNLNKAADLLLAFAKNDIKTEPSHEEQTRNASTPISSNCLLVEAAVGPIDQDNNFKLPISQAKTKKTMMNNWFNQNEYALHIPCMDSPKSPGYDSPLASPSMALKKVEEFITQADGIQNLQQPSLQQVVSPQTTNQHPSTLQIQGVSTCANNSSVKKRWLRQAISEESETVSDSMTTPTTPTVPTPTTPITPNGFMTPLKKRRLLIDTSPVEISHDIKEEIEDPQQPPLSPKIEVKHEETEEVDIIRSPSPGSRKIVVEDNQVKIEPEDPGSEEMQVDVEKEEVDDVKEIKEEIVIKQEIKEENNLEDILHSFHKENLLNLEARNREKKSALGDEKKTIKKEKKEKKKIKKKKKSKFSDSEEKNDKRKLSCSSTSSTLSSISILSNEVPPPQFDVPPIVTTPLPLPPPPPLPASIARIETPPPMTTTTLPPPPQSEVRAISTLPYYNTIYSKFNSFMDHHPVVSSSPRPPSPIACSILTPDYLDAKLKSYNSLGGFVSQRTSSLLGGLSIEINGSQSPTTSSTSMAINNTPVATSKPFTKTASHDPRLNPQLTAPEPAPTPKRKVC